MILDLKILIARDFSSALQQRRKEYEKWVCHFPSPDPDFAAGDTDEKFDYVFGDEKRAVSTGPNPLHN
ncbi:hypothetical protein Ancab_000212 [Ancistrocladus abbreviatus]